MKLSYKPDGGSYTVLADESAGASILSDFAPSFTALMQQNPVFRSDRQFRQGRGNAVCSFPIRYFIQYDDDAAALASIRVLAQGVFIEGALFHLKLEQSGTAAETQYYPNAVFTDYKPIKTGRAVEHQFTVSSDNVTDTAP